MFFEIEKGIFQAPGGAYSSLATLRENNPPNKLDTYPEEKAN